MVEQLEYDIIVVGGGPAGFTAGIYGARANHSVLILEGMQPGGQLTTTTEVENFPGFPQGVDGTMLVSQMRDQAVRFGAVDKFESVSSIDMNSYPYKVVSGETTYLAKAVILATGASARYLGLENENRLKGRGVSACATCDGFFFKDKVLAVVGGGDSAMEEANFLTKFATKVYLVHRREEFKASPIMLDRVKNNPKIEIIVNSAVDDVLGDDAVTGLSLKNTVTGELSTLPVDGMFLAIGHIPNVSLVKDFAQVLPNGYLKVVPDTSKTTVEGLFAAGDVCDSVYRQAITAAGSGCKAALDAQHFIEHNDSVSSPQNSGGQ